MRIACRAPAANGTCGRDVDHVAWSGDASFGLCARCALLYRGSGWSVQRAGRPEMNWLAAREVMSS